MPAIILELSTIFLSILGVITSFFTFNKKRKAELNLEILLKQKVDELEKIKEIGNPTTNSSEHNRVLSYDEFVQLQDTIKKLVGLLEKNERNEILESLEQKSIKGQVDYLNKIMHMSGSTDNYIVKTE